MNNHPPGIISLLATLLMVATFCGCSTGGGGSNHSYRQDPQFRDMRGEHVAAYDYMGKIALGKDHEAENWKIDVQYCPAQGSSGEFGPYSCDTGCMNTAGGGCAHATAGFWGGIAHHTYAGSSPMPNTILHEAKHPFLQRYADNPAELAINNGHPKKVTINGVLMDVDKLSPRKVRWPLVKQIVGAADWVRDRVTDSDWSENCDFGAMKIEEE